MDHLNSNNTTTPYSAASSSASNDDRKTMNNATMNNAAATTTISYRTINGEDMDEIKAIYQLEVEAFPPTEAESWETIYGRSQVATPYLFIAVQETVASNEEKLDQDSPSPSPSSSSSSSPPSPSSPSSPQSPQSPQSPLPSTTTTTRKYLGFIMGTLSPKDRPSLEAMHSHSPNSPNLCIHSVVVTSSARGNGFGSKFFKQFVEYIEKERVEVQKILLLSKHKLLKFYESAGFTNLGESAVKYGLDVWFDCELKCQRDNVANNNNQRQQC